MSEEIKGLDLTGERFGMLTVIEFAGHRKRGKKNDKLWRCKCDCGKESLVLQHNLICGNTQSCGCMRGRKFTTRGDL